MNDDIVDNEMNAFRNRLAKYVELSGAANISRASGVGEPSLSRFLKGGKGLELGSYLKLLYWMSGATPSLGCDK